ncbi:MAG: hypothetical protein GX410_05605 [Elusimicrobia bacterium]|nr:hypothetical protein [Elusimicrobiota bacterium]
MKTLFWGNLLFAAGLALHFIWWRISLPVRQAKALGLLLAAVSVSGLAALYFFTALPFRPESGPEFFNLALYLAAFCLAYLITYSAVEVDSPSLVMISRIARSGASGISRAELDADMGDEVLVLPRVADLLTDKMAVLENGCYRLAPKGVLLAAFFRLSRKALKAGKGG